MDLDRISVNPEVYHGKPCVRGTRIPVYLILEMLEYGTTIPEILEEYPSLTENDVKACIAYAKNLVEQVGQHLPIQDQVSIG